MFTKLRIALDVFWKGGWKQLCWKCRHALWMRKYRRLDVDLEYVSCQDLSLSEHLYGHYSTTPGPELEKVLKTRHIGPEDSVIDIGCGKGGALISMAAFPFAKIAGLEISQDLVTIAKTNLNKLGINHVEVFHSDAVNFRELNDFNYIYLYNPFKGVIFEQFIRNVKESLARRPRMMTIIYRNPKCHEMVVADGMFEKVLTLEFGPHPWFIYNSKVQKANPHA